MPRKRKFRPGPVIGSMAVLTGLLEEGCWIYWRHKPQHPTVLVNMSYSTLRRAVRYVTLRLALRNEEATP